MRPKSLRERLLIHYLIIALFCIPVLCILIIALIQVWDEMFKKKFVIERRDRSSARQGTIHDRATAPKGPQTLRFKDAGFTPTIVETVPESAATKHASDLGASGNHC